MKKVLIIINTILFVGFGFSQVYQDSSIIVYSHIHSEDSLILFEIKNISHSSIYVNHDMISIDLTNDMGSRIYSSLWKYDPQIVFPWEPRPSDILQPYKIKPNKTHFFVSEYKSVVDTIEMIFKFEYLKIDDYYFYFNPIRFIDIQDIDLLKNNIKTVDVSWGNR